MPLAVPRCRAGGWAILAIGLAMARPAPAIAQTGTVGITYVVQSGAGGVLADRLRVAVLGHVARVDPIGSGAAARDGSWLLLRDEGQRVIIVHRAKRSWRDATAESFETRIGRIPQGIDESETVRLRDARVWGEPLGAGPVLLGHATVHARLTQEYTAVAGTLGSTADVRQRVVTEYWTSPTLALPENPALLLLATRPTVFAQHDSAFAARSRAARRRLVSGAPLKTVVTVWTGDDPVPQVHVIVLRDVRRRGLDPARCRVPRGYAPDHTTFGWQFPL